MHSKVMNFLSFILVTLLTLPLHAKPMMIFDAGSTGTRVYLYEVDNGQATLLSYKKIKTGLATLDPTQSAPFDALFNPLVASVASVQTVDEKAMTPMILYGTAGLRMLPEPQREALIQATLDSLTRQADLFGYPLPLNNQVRAISGTEEAVFIWVADNYLSGTLQPGQFNLRKSFAALEMGGASSEIAFLSPRGRVDTLPFSSYKGSSKDIYGVGYDGLGADKALAAVQASANPAFAACFPVGAPYPLTNPVLTGTGDLNACVDTIKAALIDPTMLNACKKRYGAQCSGFGAFQPLTNPPHQYLLTSAFFYLFDTLGIANQTLTQADFLNKARTYCSTDWATIQTTYPGDPTYLINYCFTASLSKTLFDGWKLNSTASLKAISTLNGTPVEWPIGAALYLGQPK